MSFEQFLNTINIYSPQPYGTSQSHPLENAKINGLTTVCGTQTKGTTHHISSPKVRGANPKVKDAKSKCKKCKCTLNSSDYSKDQWLASEMTGVLNKNRVLPESVVPYVLRIGKKPNLDDAKEKEFWTRSFDESIGRMKSCLWDRIKGGVNKSGRRLFVGSMKGSVFEQFFGDTWNGERKIVARRFGSGQSFEDWAIEVRFSFHKGNPFLMSLNPKAKCCTDTEQEHKLVERQEIHFYTDLQLNWNIFTGNVTCKWQQESWKRVNGKWHPIY